MREDECNILVNLSREEYREFRSLVIDMVLATDMSCHFQQIKAAKSLLSVTELRQSDYLLSTLALSELAGGSCTSSSGRLRTIL